MRLAYRALRVLSPEWTDEVHQAGSQLALMAYERDLAGVTQRDVPVAIDLLSRSRFFTLVLDEDPAGDLPAELADSGETQDERIQRVPHPARIGIWDLKLKSQLLRLRGEAAGAFVQVGNRAIQNPINLAAQQRQTNNCQLALAARNVLVAGKIPEGPP